MSARDGTEGRPGTPGRPTASLAQLRAMWGKVEQLDTDTVVRTSPLTGREVWRRLSGGGSSAVYQLTRNPQD